MRQPIIILGSPRAIFELLDKRSAITSDRIRAPMIPLYVQLTRRTCGIIAHNFDSIGQDGNFSLMPYGSWWRRHRRAFWQHFLPASIATHVSAQKGYAQMFLRKLLADPSRLREHIR